MTTTSPRGWLFFPYSPIYWVNFIMYLGPRWQPVVPRTACFLSHYLARKRDDVFFPEFLAKVMRLPLIRLIVGHMPTPNPVSCSTLDLGTESPPSPEKHGSPKWKSGANGGKGLVAVEQ